MGTGYFKHDLATRSLDAVEYVVPATSQPRSIFTISEAQVEQIGFFRGGAIEDASWYTSSGPQINGSCRKALSDKDVRAKLSHLKAHVLVGVATIIFCVTPPWTIGHEDAEAGGGLMNVRWLTQANHLVGFDDSILMGNMLLIDPS